MKSAVPALEPIHTTRLMIRDLHREDRGILRAFVRDPTQIEHMLLFLDTEEQLDAFLSKAVASINEQPRLQWHLAVEDIKSGCLVGSCCLMIEAEAPSSAELGYWFLREHWGYGYATEASQAMLEFGFRHLGLHRIWGKCHVRNEASAKILEKLGMTFEGTLREHVWLRDHFRSSRVYGILDAEYSAPAKQRS